MTLEDFTPTLLYNKVMGMNELIETEFAHLTTTELRGTILYWLGISGQDSQVMSLLQDIENTIGIDLNIANSLMSMYADRGAPLEAQKIIRYMMKNKIEPNEETFDKLGLSYLNHEEPFLVAREFIDTRSDSLVGSQDTLSDLLTGYYQRNRANNGYDHMGKNCQRLRQALTRNTVLTEKAAAALMQSFAYFPLPAIMKLHVLLKTIGYTNNSNYLNNFLTAVTRNCNFKERQPLKNDLHFGVLVDVDPKFAREIYCASPNILGATLAKRHTVPDYETEGRVLLHIWDCGLHQPGVRFSRKLAKLTRSRGRFDYRITRRVRYLYNQYQIETRGTRLSRQSRDKPSTELVYIQYHFDPTDADYYPSEDNHLDWIYRAKPYILEAIDTLMSGQCDVNSQMKHSDSHMVPTLEACGMAMNNFLRWKKYHRGIELWNDMQTRLDWGHYTTTPIVDAGYMECLAHMGRFEEAMTMFASCSRALGESNSSEIEDEMNFFQYRSQSTLHLVREYSDNPELQSIAGQLESTLFVDNWQRHKGSVAESTHSWRYKFGSHPHHRTFWDTQAQKWSKTTAKGVMDQAAGVGDEESIPRTGLKTPLQEFVYTGGVNEGERHEDSETGVRPWADVHDDLQWDIQDTDITDLPVCDDTHGAMASAQHYNIYSHTNTDSDARATALLTIVRAHKPTAIPQRTKIRDIKYKPYSRRVLAQNPNIDGRAHSRRVEKSEQQERAELELAGEYAKWDQRQPRQARHIRTKGKDYGMLREITNLWMDGDSPEKMAGERKGRIGLGGAHFVETMRTKFAETMGTTIERDGAGESLDDLAGVDAEEKTTSSENKWWAKNLDVSSMRRKGSIGDGDKIERKKNWAKNEDNEKGRRTKNEIEKKNHDKRGKGRGTTRRVGGLERDREETL